MRYTYRCPNCGETDYIVSVEEEVHYYEIHPDAERDKCYTGYSDVIDGQIEFILCRNCGSDFHESRLEGMIVNLEEEE